MKKNSLKKILFISHSLDIAGAQLILKNIITALDRNKYHLSVYSPCDGELKADYENDGISVHIQDFYVDGVNRDMGFEFSLDQRKKISKFLENCRKNKTKLAIRCAGSITNKLLSEFDFSGIELVGIFDNNVALIDQEINGYRVFATKNIENFTIDKVLIAHTKPEFLKHELSCGDFTIIDNLFSESLLECLGKFAKYLFQMVYPMQYFAKINPETVFVNNARNFWAVIVGKLLGKKVIWAIHENFEPKTFKVFPQSLYFWSFKLADKFIFPSNATYQFYKSLAAKHKVNIIHCGVDINRIVSFKNDNSVDILKKELNIPENHKIISSIGTFEERKGQLYLIKSAINLLKEPKEPLTFLMVGSKSNEYSENIIKLVEESGYKDNIRIIPVTKEVYKYFYIADIVISTSIVDVMPTIVLMEAMAFEKAIIATDIFPNTKGIIHNKTGILIPIENMGYHLEKNIKYLIENDELMFKLSKNAYNEYLENFTFERTLEEYNRVINL